MLISLATSTLRISFSWSWIRVFSMNRRWQHICMSADAMNLRWEHTSVDAVWSLLFTLVHRVFDSHILCYNKLLLESSFTFYSSRFLQVHFYFYSSSFEEAYFYLYLSTKIKVVQSPLILTDIGLQITLNCVYYLFTDENNHFSCVIRCISIYFSKDD